MINVTYAKFPPLKLACDNLISLGNLSIEGFINYHPVQLEITIIQQITSVWHVNYLYNPVKSETVKSGRHEHTLVGGNLGDTGTREIYGWFGVFAF